MEAITLLASVGTLALFGVLAHRFGYDSRDDFTAPPQGAFWSRGVEPIRRTKRSRPPADGPGTVMEKKADVAIPVMAQRVEELICCRLRARLDHSTSYWIAKS